MLVGGTVRCPLLACKKERRGLWRAGVGLNPLKGLDLTEERTFGFPSARLGNPSVQLGFPSDWLGFPSAQLGIPSVRLGNGRCGLAGGARLGIPLGPARGGRRSPRA